MLSLSDLAEYRRGLSSLDLLIASDMADLVDYVASLLDRREVARLVKVAAPEVVLKYSPVSAALAADMYERSRAAEGARGSFTAEVADPAPMAALEGSAGFALKSVFRADPDMSGLLATLVGSARRHVGNAGRWTTMRNAAREGVAWYRQPRPGACPFCLMLASRGAVYASEASARATGVSGRSRGTRPAGDKFHDFCGCVAVRAPLSGEVPREIADLGDAWADVTAGLSGQAARDAWVASLSPAA